MFVQFDRGVIVLGSDEARAKPVRGTTAAFVSLSSIRASHSSSPVLSRRGTTGDWITPQHGRGSGDKQVAAILDQVTMTHDQHPATGSPCPVPPGCYNLEWEITLHYHDCDDNRD